MFDWLKKLFSPSTNQSSSLSLPSSPLSVTNNPILGGGAFNTTTAQSTPQTINSSKPSPLPSFNLPSSPLSVTNNPILGGTGIGNIGGFSNSTPQAPLGVSTTPAIRPIGPTLQNGSFSSGGSPSLQGPVMQSGAFYSGGGGSSFSSPSIQSTPSAPPPTVFSPTVSQSTASPFTSGSLSGSLGFSTSPLNIPTALGGSMFSGNLLNGPFYGKTEEDEKKKKGNKEALVAQPISLIQTPNRERFSVERPGSSLTPGVASQRDPNSISREELYPGLNDRLTQELNDANRENPPLDAPIQNDLYQEAIVNQQPPERRRSLQAEIDKFKADNGYSDALKEKQRLGLELQKVNKIFGEAISEIQNNPELPKGLAARRIADLNKEWNLTASQLTGTISVLNETLKAIDDEVNTRLKVYEIDNAGVEQPGSVQEYQYAVSQGYQGSYTDFKSLNSSGVTINMGEQIQGAVEKQNALQNAADTQTINSAYKTIKDITAKYGISNPADLTADVASLMSDQDAAAIGKATAIIQNPLSSKVNPDDIQDALQPNTILGKASAFLARNNPFNDDYDKSFSPSKLIEAVQNASRIASGRGTAEYPTSGTTSSGLRYTIEEGN